MRGRKSNFIACVHCRQMKLACDAPSRFPAGCSRCSKAGRVCSVDPSFKRTKRRQRLQQVEQELRQVKEALGNRQEESIEATSIDSGATGIPAPLPPDLPSHEDENSVGEELESGMPTSKSIGGIHLSSSTISDLLNEYYESYHPICPILPKISSFYRHTEDFPFLFWTVMLTALKNKSCDGISYAFLAEQSVQALLILSHWNVPFERLPTDPSLSFVNMATQICIRVGLHRPVFTHEFDKASAVQKSIDTGCHTAWIFCFISNVSINAQFGLPSSVRLDHGLMDVLASKPSWLPATLYCQLHISHVLLRILTTLGCHESTSTGLLPNPEILVTVFEGDLRMLETHLSQHWTQVDRLNFCTCKLMLYVISLSALYEAGVQPNSSHSEIRSRWILQAYLASISSIQAASVLCDHLTKMPTRVFKSLAGAVSFLILLKCSKYHNLLDATTLSNAIRQGWELMKKFEATPTEFLTRTCSMLERLSSYSESLSTNERTEEIFSAKARMGFNVVRSTVLLLHRTILNKKHGNETELDDSDAQFADMDANPFDLFMDFDWDGSLLSLQA